MRKTDRVIYLEVLTAYQLIEYDYVVSIYIQRVHYTAFNLYHLILHVIPHIFPYTIMYLTFETISHINDPASPESQRHTTYFFKVRSTCHVSTSDAEARPVGIYNSSSHTTPYDSLVDIHIRI